MRHELDELVLLQQETLHRRLQRRRNKWSALKLGKLAAEIVGEGAPLLWRSAERPKLGEITIQTKNSPEIQQWLEKGLNAGFLMKVKRSFARALSPVFVLPKPGGSGFRFIFNLKRLNTFLRAPKFRMENLSLLSSLIRPNDSLVKIDIKDAFFHLTHKQEDWPYLCFEVNGQVYCHRGMSMGSVCSPYLFAKITRPMVAQWRSRGIRMVMYADDLLLMAPDHLIEEQKCIILEDLAHLGWTVNVEKSALEPTKKQRFLGFIVTTQPTPQLSLESKKRAAIAHELCRLARRPKTLVRYAMRVAGLALSIKPVLREVEPLIRGLLRQIGGKNPSTTIELKPGTQSDLAVLGQLVRQKCKRSLDPQPTGEIVTDAASGNMMGFALIVNGRLVAHAQKQTPSQHINLSELQAVQEALAEFKNELVGHKFIRVQLDNSAAAAYVRRGTGRRPRLASLGRSIFFQAKKMGVELLPELVPGKDHHLADLLSRVTTRRLTAEALNRLQITEGQLICPKWFSVKTIFRLIEAATAAKMAVATPNWPAAPWFPQLIATAAAAARIPQEALANHSRSHLLSAGLLVWRLTSEQAFESQRETDSFATRIATSPTWAWCSRH